MALRGTFSGATIHGDKLAELIRSPNGTVMRQLLQRADDVKAKAQELVGYNDSPDRTSTLPHLRDTIVKRVVDSGHRAAVQIGSEHPIALMHHEGTNAHVIEAHGGRTVDAGGRTRINGKWVSKATAAGLREPRLVFYWAKVGRVVAFRRVNHPGTQPNHYLTDALEVLRGRW